MVQDIIDADLAAVFAGGLSLAAYVPYSMSVLQGFARPQRSSWFVWALLSTLAVVSVGSTGGAGGLIFAGAQMAGTCTIFLLSLWRGTGSFGHANDLIVLGGASLGVTLWAITSDPAWALGLSITVGALAGTLTISKAYKDPHSEALLPWTLQWMASVFGMLSVVGASLMEVAYPTYLFALYTAITVAELLGRKGVPLNLRYARVPRAKLRSAARLPKPVPRVRREKRKPRPHKTYQDAA